MEELGEVLKGLYEGMDELETYPMGKHQSLTLLVIFCMLANRSLVWLFSERLHPAADSDIYRQPQPSSEWNLWNSTEE